MVTPKTPPPWEDLGRLLWCGVYLYLVFALVAILCASLQSSPLLKLLRNPIMEVSDKQKTPFLSLAAVSDFFTRFAIHIAVGRMFTSTAICTLYVYVTYVGYIPKPLLFVQKFMGVVLTLQFIGKMIVHPRPLHILRGIETCMEVLSFASLVMARSGDWLNFSFLQAYIVLARYFQIEPVIELVFLEKTSPLRRQLTRLTCQFVVFIYVFACGLQLFERMGDPWTFLTATTFELTLANSFYFTVVTIFTVGYGDFVPYTLMGRLWIIFIIVFGAYLVSRKVAQVADVISGLRKGRGSFVKGEGVDHCVVCGNVKWEYLKSFVQEFYGDSRNNGKKLVVICDNPNWTEETWNKFFTSHPQFRNHVVYLEGACVTRDDLVRAQVDDAKAVFVMSNQHNPDPYAEDSETLKRILTIRSYTPNLPIYSMCALRDSMLQITYALEQMDDIEAEGTISRHASMQTGISNFSYQGRGSSTDVLRHHLGSLDPSATSLGQPVSGDITDGDEDDGMYVPNYDGSTDLKSEAICMQEVETSILAENVFCNGLSTLLANLILRVNPQRKSTDQPWATEYKIGAECRFEYLRLPMKLHAHKFSEIAMIMYDFGVLLVATKRFMDKKWKAITPDTTIHLNTIGLIITFHSASFLDHIMHRIADVVCETHDLSSGSDAGTVQDVPSVEDELPRYSVAGDLLTGEIPVYQGNQPPMFARTISSLSDNHIPMNNGFEVGFQGDIVGNPRSLPEQSFSSREQAPGSERAKNSNRILERIEMLNTALDDGESPGVGVAGPVEDEERRLPAPSLRLRGLRNEIPQHDETYFPSATDDEIARRYSSNLSRLAPHAFEDKPREGDPRHAVDFRVPPIVDRSIGIQRPEEVDNELDSEEHSSHPKQTSLHVHSSIRKRTKPKQHVSFPNHKMGLNISSGSRENGGTTRNVGSSSARTNSMEEDAKAAKEKRAVPIFYYGDDELPVQLKGHIVVCVIGRVAMMNLKHFLQRVWVERGESAENTPVVSICPRLSEEDEADFGGYSPGQLFLIQGNSLSVKTLKRAQFDQAKAIVILACEDKNDVDHMDAKAIFTVMTLDYLLGERSETFVCTMLDAEESMQLLRAPSKPRRRGADLYSKNSFKVEYGFPLQSFGPVSLSSTRLRSYYSVNYRRRLFSESRRGFPESRRSAVGGASMGPYGVPRSLSFVGIRNSTFIDRKAAIERQLGVANPSASEVYRRMSTNSYGAYNPANKHNDDDLTNFPSVGGASALNFMMNPSTLTMRGGGPIGYGDGFVDMGRGLRGSQFSRARDESFEKQRYASGEMMISSTYMALLIREYAMPGLMAVVRNIFGAGVGKNAKSKKCWIRAIQVPQDWITSGEGGRRTYRELFETLLRHGAVALGLYRSGDGVVRIQLEVDDVDGTNPQTSPRMKHFVSDFVEGDETSTPPADDFDSHNESEGSGGLEIGGESVPRLRASQSFERRSILHNLPTYGTMDQTRRGRLDPVEEDNEIGESRDEASHYPIPPSIMFHMAEDVHAAQQNSEYDEDGHEDIKMYTCPNTRMTAMYREVPGGENVLPYVYTNPEAFTLVSEKDAVYVLMSPQQNVPDVW
eukprot:GFKZ01007054.1.p1 GENE.GFKZ01007054.1~~GFKZ01007054.1.p1  ORF type:complete len:1586 (-),score=225.71 GFKZ01007054.1:1601-6358(-)